MKNVLITGVAGFIGFHTAQVLLSQGKAVTGIDNLNDYYDVNLKQARFGQFDVILYLATQPREIYP